MIRLFSVKLTNSCVKQILNVCGQEQGLRLEVEAGDGCGGFSYKFSVDSEKEGDMVFRQDEAKLIVDKDSFSIVDGATVDYTQELIRRSFVVLENPQADMRCGVSFSPNF